MTQKTMTEKDMFLQTWQREFDTTIRVLKAYPPGKEDFKPADKSRTARDLAWTFVLETHVGMGATAGKIDFSQPMPPAPAAPMSGIIAMYEKAWRDSYAKVQAMSEADYQRMMAFPVGPKQMAEFRAADVLWTMLSDMVHHRGQFSVYLRMVGAKVPSIYGPTADENWM